MAYSVLHNSNYYRCEPRNLQSNFIPSKSLNVWILRIGGEFVYFICVRAGVSGRVGYVCTYVCDNSHVAVTSTRCETIVYSTDFQKSMVNNVFKTGSRLYLDLDSTKE